MGSIFSPGKLLITSEYLVLDGALALAVPTQLGQEFFFEESIDDSSEIYWEAYHEQQLWFFAKINYQDWSILETNNTESAHFILHVLQQVQSLSSLQFKNKHSYHLKTNLQFPANYGLGSSSTLMNNLAQWAEIDPYILNEKSLGGSGYDIAVAQKKKPLLYRNTTDRLITEVSFSPPFLDDLLLVHLNQKQNSREGISLYKSKTKSPQLIDDFSNITLNVLKSKTIEEFSDLLEIHERELSSFLGVQTAKSKWFSDYSGTIKSLGAWGGDFILATKSGNYQNYFKSKNYTTFFDWKDIVA